jgi:hypothetical protein
MQSILENLYMDNIQFDGGYYGQHTPFGLAAKRKHDSLDSMEKLLAGLDVVQAKGFQKRPHNE